jgi:hypothetical protein
VLGSYPARLKALFKLRVVSKRFLLQLCGQFHEAILQWVEICGFVGLEWWVVGVDLSRFGCKWVAVEWGAVAQFPRTVCTAMIRVRIENMLLGITSTTPRTYPTSSWE